MDNRLGCFVALEAARLVAEAGGAPGDVVAVAAAQEEITLGGAQTVAYRLQPDVAIVVDVTHATDVPGVDERENGTHPLGSGPVLTRGSTLHPRVFEPSATPAEAEGIAFTVEAIGARDRDRRRRDRPDARRHPLRGSSACRCATCTRPSRLSSSPT